ncbi:GNAT family N-acetyltransferase [Nanoarchaeota archaeon]
MVDYEKNRPIKLVGEKIKLGPLIESDLEYFTNWFNDIDVMQYWGLAHEVESIEKMKKWFDKMKDQKDEAWFTILEKDSLKPIGLTGLVEINLVHRNAEYAIFIGDKKYWSNGYGTDAGKLVMDYGFNLLNLHNILLHVYDFNKRGIKSYEKFGFKEIGRQSEWGRFNGNWVDMITMELLDRNFKHSRIEDHLTK